METNSVITSFAGLFLPFGEASPLIQRIEIPLIQRDYAQGRESPRVQRIRENFLDTLHVALSGGDPVGLDFVYGEVDEKGTLEPLDGQQRLTTLFLLHWYVAARTGRIDELKTWARFSYATRPSARLFCERLVAFAPPAPGQRPSTVIKDQPWYLHVWAHDPTIQSMLVMLDAIDDKFGSDDLDAAWHRLLDEASPAISFHLLPIDDMGSTQDLYIKMNSRGKPLTDFENFKARVEKALDGTARADEFGRKIDGSWADVMWPLRGDDDIVDDEFLRYMRYIIEMCEWRQGDTESKSVPLVDRAERTFVRPEPNDADELAFLFDAFDAWVDIDTSAFFSGLLKKPGESAGSTDTRLALFGAEGSNNLNLFDACCRDLDTQRFGNPRKLLLYALLQHLIHHTDDFPRRLRAVRNLVEASENEIRPARLPRLLTDVEKIIVDGDLTQVEAFNQAQLDDEIQKRRFLEQHPELETCLYQLEDLEILRGSLMAFELDPEHFEQRAKTFETLFANPSCLHALTGALLTVGDYQRRIGPTMYRFGSPEQPSQWREVLTGPSRANIVNTRETLGRLLDLVAASGLPPAERLLQIQHDWLQAAEAEQHFDWRYYLVKYSAMREGKSGVYGFSGEQLGFSLCMLERQQMNSYYRDPYLLAVARECGIEGRVTGTVIGNSPGAWFTGYATAARWMTLTSSDVQIRCLDSGFALLPPEEPAHQAAFKKVCADHSIAMDADGAYVLDLPGAQDGDSPIDAEDRVKLAASVVAELVAAGL